MNTTRDFSQASRMSFLASLMAVIGGYRVHYIEGHSRHHLTASAKRGRIQYFLKNADDNKSLRIELAQVFGPFSEDCHISKPSTFHMPDRLRQEDRNIDHNTFQDGKQKDDSKEDRP